MAWHDLRRRFYGGDFRGLEVPEDFSAGHARDVEAGLAEALWIPRRDARPLSRDFSSEKLGLPDTTTTIPNPLGHAHRAELQWMFENFVAFPLQPSRYRTSRLWRPLAERADFTRSLCAFVETGDRFELAPIIYGVGVLSLPDNRAEFANALCLHFGIGHHEAWRILDDHSAGAPRRTFEAIKNLRKPIRGRGGRRAHALCFGPTVHEYRAYARTLSSKTKIPTQSIEQTAQRIGVLRPRGKFSSRSQQE